MSPEEVQILKQARLFKELVSTESWQELTRVMEAQIRFRESLIMSPLHALPPGSVPPEADIASKAAAMEMFKGAIIGIKLVLATPQATIESAADIARESKEKVNG